jgi:hypothetical protein
MDDIPWYSDASLAKPGHVFCVGLLTNCVRKWLTLSEDDKHAAILRMSRPIDRRVELNGDQIDALAKQLEGLRR